MEEHGRTAFSARQLHPEAYNFAPLWGRSKEARTKARTKQFTIGIEKRPWPRSYEHLARPGRQRVAEAVRAARTSLV